MLSIFKKKQTGAVDLSAIGTDMHSHLLPGIDDGSPDVVTSLSLIKGMQELGFNNLITTPHIYWEIHKNSPATISAAEQTLQPVLQTELPTIPLKAAAEYFLDDHFDSLLSTNTPLLTIKSNWVLVEFSFVSAPMDLKEKLFELQIKGYQPVLAHPERYSYLIPKKQVFDTLKDAGCLFQLNLLSLTGYYGKPALELAQYLLKKKYVDLVGTDLHHVRHLQALQSASSLMDPVKALLDSGRLQNPSL